MSKSLGQSQQPISFHNF